MAANHSLNSPFGVLSHGSHQGKKNFPGCLIYHLVNLLGTHTNLSGTLIKPFQECLSSPYTCKKLLLDLPTSDFANLIGPFTKSTLDQY